MTQSRHLPWHLFQENYLDPAVPALLPIPGTPKIYIAFQPQSELLALITNTHCEKPVSIDRQNIFSDIFDLDGETTSRVYVRDEPLFREFYAICMEAADRCQLGGEAFETAVTETIQAFELLLRSAIALPANVEIGLTGELLILEALLQVKGPAAVDGWRGADRDMHDFRIDDQEIEVKSTTGSKRQHWIHGFTQLTASENCQLDLVSIQFARTAGEGTLSLKRLVARILEALSNSRIAMERFRDSLHKVVTEDQLKLVESQFHIRDKVMGFNVDTKFPRLSVTNLNAVIGDPSKHVADVNYLLNLDDYDGPLESPLTTELLTKIRELYA